MRFLMSLCLVLSVALISEWALAGGAHGVFRVVKGQVSVQSSQTGKVSRARLGSKVLPGDVILTKKDSRAKIVMVDNNEINISPNSEIKIEKYEYDPKQGKKNVLLNVIYGKVRSKVEQKYDGRTSKFQVKTKSAVAGVRGTDFITSYAAETGASQVITFEGRVEFGTLGPQGQIMNPVQVIPGQMAVIEQGGGMPARPQAIPKENLKQMDTESNADSGGGEAASGDQQAVTPTPKKETVATGESSESNRQPSAAPRPSEGGMIQNGDLPSAPGAGGLPPTDPMAAPPMIPGADLGGADQAVRDAIQNGNATLKINVQQ